MTAYSIKDYRAPSAETANPQGIRGFEQPPAYTPSHTGLTPTSTGTSHDIYSAPRDQPAAGSRKPSSFGQRFHSITSRAGWPLNKAANVIGAEGWWPTNMQKECSKAARILYSFTSKLFH